ncbi:von Willebrand factor A domain-containing protein 7-like [Arapaima gigas]
MLVGVEVTRHSGAGQPSTGIAMAASRPLLAVSVCLVLSGSVSPFFTISRDRKLFSHVDITERAVLRKSEEVCRDQAVANGRNFSLSVKGSLSAASVLHACFPDINLTLVSDMKFKVSIKELVFSYKFFSNGIVDHENLAETQKLLIRGVGAVKDQVREGNFMTAWQTLGGLLHKLQDFYSHVGWINMKNKVPFSTLMQPDLLMDHPGNSLNNTPLNLRSLKNPTGETSEDGLGSSPGPLHNTAALMATDASVDLLEDIRRAAGDTGFLMLMGIRRYTTLCFVIDTTNGIANVISKIREVVFSIIDKRRSTPDELFTYVLVPFNDPSGWSFPWFKSLV